MSEVPPSDPPPLSRWPRWGTLVLLAILGLGLAGLGAAVLAKARSEDRPPPEIKGGAVGQVTGLPLPRFVALAADRVNLRTGPGARYPIAWVYLRLGLPVEVVAEYQHYREVRDSDGTEGWVQEDLITGRRMALVTGRGPHPLLDEPDARSRILARVEPGVIGHLLKCRAAYCKLDIKGYRGYLPRDDLFGVLPGEDVN